MESIIISGEIIDFSDGTPLKDVSVVVSGSDIDPVCTNEEGIFELVLSEYSSENVELVFSKEALVFPIPVNFQVSTDDIMLDSPILAVDESSLSDSSIHIIITDEIIDEDDRREWRVRTEISDVDTLIDSSKVSEYGWIEEFVDEENGIITITLNNPSDELHKFYMIDAPDSQIVTAYIFSSSNPEDVSILSMPEHHIIDPDWDIFWMKDGSIHIVNQIEPDGVLMVGDPGPAGGTIIFDKGLRDAKAWEWVYDVEYNVLSNPRFAEHETETSMNAWRYLEVAPRDIVREDSRYEASWGIPEEGSTWGFGSLETSFIIGKGMENSTLIWENYKDQTGVDDLAATLCLDYEFGGKDDWFLPTHQELLVLYDYMYNDDGIIHSGDTDQWLDTVQFQYDYRWTSSQYTQKYWDALWPSTEPNEAYSCYRFDTGYRTTNKGKDSKLLVRPMRVY